MKKRPKNLADLDIPRDLTLETSSQETRLLEKRKDMYEVQENLDNQKKKFDLKRTDLKKMEETYKEKDKQLMEEIEKYNTKYQEISKEVKENQKQTKNLDEEIKEILNEKNKISQEIENLIEIKKCKQENSNEKLKIFWKATKLDDSFLQKKDESNEKGLYESLLKDLKKKEFNFSEIEEIKNQISEAEQKKVKFDPTKNEELEDVNKQIKEYDDEFFEKEKKIDEIIEYLKEKIPTLKNYLLVDYFSKIEILKKYFQDLKSLFILFQSCICEKNFNYLI